MCVSPLSLSDEGPIYNIPLPKVYGKRVTNQPMTTDPTNQPVSTNQPASQLTNSSQTSSILPRFATDHHHHRPGRYVCLCACVLSILPTYITGTAVVNEHFVLTHSSPTQNTFRGRQQTYQVKAKYSYCPYLLTTGITSQLLCCFLFLD